MSEACQNPLCRNPLPGVESGWRRTERLYCSDICKQVAWMLKQVREALKDCSDQQVIEIMRSNAAPRPDRPATVTPLRKKTSDG